MSETYLAALMLIGGSGGDVDRRIRAARADHQPLELDVLKQALAIESRSVGSRIVVRNLLSREIQKQEEVLA